MKSAFGLLLVISAILVAGCGEGGSDTTTQSDVNKATAELNKAAAGVEPIPDPAIAGVAGGPSGGGGVMGKPGANKPK